MALHAEVAALKARQPDEVDGMVAKKELDAATAAHSAKLLAVEQKAQKVA